MRRRRNKKQKQKSLLVGRCEKTDILKKAVMRMTRNSKPIRMGDWQPLAPKGSLGVVGNDSQGLSLTMLVKPHNKIVPWLGDTLLLQRGFQPLKSSRSKCRSPGRGILRKEVGSWNCNAIAKSGTCSVTPAAPLHL